MLYDCAKLEERDRGVTAADRALGREHGWTEIAATWREGLLAAVAR